MPRRHRLGDVGRLEHDLRVGHERSRLGVPGGAEAEHRRRAAEALREVWKGRDADPAPDEQRTLDIEPESLAERAENPEPVAGREVAERARARADRIDQEPELPGRCEADAHRSRQ